MTALETKTRAKEIDLKAKIIEEGLRQQQLVIDQYRNALEEILARQVTACGYDNHHQSFKSETNAEICLLKDQLEYSIHELEHLMHIQNYLLELHPTVEYGTVVRTDKDTFFVGIEVERFYVNDQPICGVAIQNPIYKAMKGKKVGECFRCEGTTYFIEEIF